MGEGIPFSPESYHNRQHSASTSSLLSVSMILAFNCSGINKIEHTEKIQITALVKNTETIAAAIAAAKEAIQDTGQKALVLLIGVTRLDLVLAAGNYGLGTTLLLGGLYVDITALGAARATGEGNSSGGEEGSDGKELHCD